MKAILQSLAESFNIGRFNGSISISPWVTKHERAQQALMYLNFQLSMRTSLTECWFHCCWKSMRTGELVRILNRHPIFWDICEPFQCQNSERMGLKLVQNDWNCFYHLNLAEYCFIFLWLANSLIRSAFLSECRNLGCFRRYRSARYPFLSIGHIPLWLKITKIDQILWGVYKNFRWSRSNPVKPGSLSFGERSEHSKSLNPVNIEPCNKTRRNPSRRNHRYWHANLKDWLVKLNIIRGFKS
jgi:hypothetical protein